MKKIIMLTLCAGLFAVSANAQEVKEGVKKGASEVKEVGKDVGHKTAEVSSKGYHSVKDEKYNDKVGPEGQTIYISGKDRYYYIDDKGRKVYVSKTELKDK